MRHINLENGIEQSRWVLVGILIAFTFGLGYAVGQSDFVEIFSLYLPFFLIYLAIYYGSTTEKNIRFFLFLGIFLRLLLLFSFPNLSDDIYRFIWDGRLLINGYNPFDHLPTYYVENDLSIPGIDRDLFDQLNSPEYFTIYPPIAQGIFATAVWLFPNSIVGSALVLKLFLLACEIGSIFLLVKLLRHFELPSKNVLLYALNPLIIIELVGNLHFEAAMVFFLLLAFYLLIRALQFPKKTSKQFYFSALAFSISIACKLLTIIFLPFLIKRLGWKKSFQYFLAVGIFTLLLFAPLFNHLFVNNFGESLNLYFQKFEFNASIYYIVRWIGFEETGYNQIRYIGPGLAVCTILGIGLLFLFDKKRSLVTLPQKWLFAICIYLLCATTVHPWYVTLPVVLCVFTNFRFPIVWSGLIMMTYINYSYPEYFENLRMVWVEYTLVVLYFILETWFYSTSQKQAKFLL